MSPLARWSLRLLAVAVAVAVGWPAAGKLLRADQAMPLPSSTWNLPAGQVTPRPAVAPSGTTDEPASGSGRASADSGNRLAPMTVFIPELRLQLGFHDAGATNGWLDLDSSITTGVHFANGSTLTSGAYLVAAHVNSRDLSLSPFAKLWQVQPGTQIWVSDADGRPRRYVTTGLVAYDKQALPNDIFATTGAPELVLVTCGGKLTELPDGHRQYAQNVVVRAVPVG